jgi:signal transduction histidine kinase
MSFEEPSSETVVRARFEREGRERTLRGARIYCACCLAMVVLSATYSWASEPDIALSLFPIRLAAAAAVGAIFWALGTAQGVRWSRPLLLAAMLVMSLEINALAAPLGWQQGFQYERLALVVLGTAALATWSPAWSCSGCALVVGTFLAANSISGRITMPAFAIDLGRLAIASAVTIGAAVVRERNRWRDVWQAHTLAESHQLATRQIRQLQEHSLFEARAREQEERLAHLLRVGSMGEMAAQIAHEVNQPLGAIVNYANGLSTRLRARGAEPELIEAAQSIALEGMRAAEVIRRIRKFVRRSEGDRDLTEVNELVRAAVELVEPETRRNGIDVQLRLAPSLPKVEVDRVQVEQVVVNLLRNAIEAMAGSRGHGHEILVATAVDDAAVEVRVHDSGAGVAPDVAEHMFDAFFTTKPDGVGMGLSISRSIIESHGGKLRAERNADRGMTFAFTLPLREEEMVSRPVARSS